jgi:chromosome segregation ATPase
MIWTIIRKDKLANVNRDLEQSRQCCADLRIEIDRLSKDLLDSKDASRISGASIDELLRSKRLLEDELATHKQELTKSKVRVMELEEKLKISQQMLYGPINDVPPELADQIDYERLGYPAPKKN